MKKLLALILAAALALSLVACGGGSGAGDTNTPSGGNGDTNTPSTPSTGNEDTTSTDTPSGGGEDSTPDETTPTEEPTNDVQTLSFGDSITTELFEFTPVFEGFADELANWPDENYMTPDGKISGSNPFKAGEEKTLMWFSGTVNYIGNSTTNETFTYAYKVIYDNDYVFDFDDYDTGYTVDLENVDWKYSNSMTFEPLSSKTTRYVRFNIEVPKQVETNTDKGLTVVFMIGGNEYSYNIR